MITKDFRNIPITNGDLVLKTSNKDRTSPETFQYGIVINNNVYYLKEYATDIIQVLDLITDYNEGWLTTSNTIDESKIIKITNPTSEENIIHKKLMMYLATDDREKYGFVPSFANDKTTAAALLQKMEG